MSTLRGIMVVGASAGGLPEHFDGVVAEGRVVGDNGEILDEGDGNKQPVERVAVVEWQFCDAEEVGTRERERGDGVPLQGGDEPGFERFREPEFTDRLLDRDFPKTYVAQKAPILFGLNQGASTSA